MAISHEPAGATAGSRNPGRSCGETGRADGSGLRALPPESRTQSRLEYALSPEGLYEAMLRCCSGTRWKRSVGSFELNGPERCIRLSERIRSGKYRPQAPTTFTVTRPKRREISSVGISDRIYQRSLNDNVVWPAMAPSLIKENSACQPGKGPDYSRELLARQLRRHWHHHGARGYALVMDVHGYYPNMRHDVAEACFARYLDGEALGRVIGILRAQYPGDVGYKPGSQLVQIAGVAVLSPLDHMIKERLGCRLYQRYMDDMVVLDASHEHLLEVRRQAESWLAAHGFELNCEKTRIVPLSEPLAWLGFTFHLCQSGHIDIRLKSAKMRDLKRRLRRMAKASAEGRMPRSKADGIAESVARYIGMRCSGPDQADRIMRHYRHVWEEIDGSNQGRRHRDAAQA